MSVFILMCFTTELVVDMLFNGVGWKVVWRRSAV